MAIIFISLLSSRSFSSPIYSSAGFCVLSFCVSSGLSDALGRPGWNAGRVFASSPQQHLCPRPSEARPSPLHPPRVFICRCVEGWFITLFKESNSGCVSFRILFSVSPAFTLFYLVCALLYLFGSFCCGFPNS